MLFLWSFILKEQNGEQLWISALGLCCLAAAIAMGTSQEWKQVPQVGGDHEMEMETRFSAHLRSGVICIAPVLDDVSETMGCHMRKVWHWEGDDEGGIVTQNRQRGHTSSAPFAHLRCLKVLASPSRDTVKTALTLIKQGLNGDLLQALLGLKSNPASQGTGNDRQLSLHPPCAAYRQGSGSISI